MHACLASAMRACQLPHLLFLTIVPGKTPGRSCSIAWEGAEEEVLEWRPSPWHCVSVFSQEGNSASCWGHTLFPETVRNLDYGMNLFIFPFFFKFYCDPMA